MTGLAGFQQAFGRYLRHPRGQGRPDGVVARRGRAYRELLFNNVCGVVDACYPVTRALMGERRWEQLQRRFFAEWECQTPLFCELAREFLRWVEHASGQKSGQKSSDASERALRLPAYLPSLMHYEWAELAVDIMPTDPRCACQPLDARTDETVALLAACPQVAPAHMLLQYDWPVHRIGTTFKPRKPEPTWLVVFRDADERVQFAEINAVTARLIALLVGGDLSGHAAAMQIAAELQHPSPDAVVAAAADMIKQLNSWGVIYGFV